MANLPSMFLENGFLDASIHHNLVFFEACKEMAALKKIVLNALEVQSSAHRYSFA